MKDMELAVDANNSEAIERLDKPEAWFARDLEKKRIKPIVDQCCIEVYRPRYSSFKEPVLVNKRRTLQQPGDRSRDRNVFKGV